ncbi:MAG TPA: hypothetical protein VFA18_21420 [Gemmataceae bacterium]|nr:hypothetical protein [Gemmataceae bacterium]
MSTSRRTRLPKILRQVGCVVLTTCLAWWLGSSYVQGADTPAGHAVVAGVDAAHKHLTVKVKRTGEDQEHMVHLTARQEVGTHLKGAVLTVYEANGHVAELRLELLSAGKARPVAVGVGAVTQVEPLRKTILIKMRKDGREKVLDLAKRTGSGDHLVGTAFTVYEAGGKVVALGIPIASSSESPAR